MARSKPTVIILTILPYCILLFFAIDIFTYRFTDRFLVGTAHGNVGFDFYSVPRSFINLQHGKSIFNTDFASWYGPYATPFYYHPVISIAVGSWLSVLPARTAFGVFIIVIAALLIYAGNVWSRHFAGAIEKKLVVLLTACSLPVYLVMWNAQMHIFTVLAVVLILSAVIDLYNNKTSTGKLIAGLLISLFSKPIILLWIPALLIVQETRPATIKALIVYALVSLLFFIVPFLQPDGSNLTHWENIVNQSTSVGKDKEYFSFATTFPLPLPGKLKNSLYLMIPLLLCASALRLRRVYEKQERLKTLLFLLLALLAGYYFAYSLVWEYHYTTILAAVPCIYYLYDLSNGTEKKQLRHIFLMGLLLCLPTTYFLTPELNDTAILVMHLCKVLPVTLMMAGLVSLYYKKIKRPV